MKTATQENYTGTDAIRDALKIKSHQINMNMLAHDPGRAAGDAVLVHAGSPPSSPTNHVHLAGLCG